MNFYQPNPAHGRVGDAVARGRADRASTKADRSAEEVRRLQQQVERLSLVCQAMWELLRDRSDLTEEELETKVLEVDLRDGRTDGKMRQQPVDCPACGQKTNSRRDFCLMCGAPLKRPHLFEG